MQKEPSSRTIGIVGVGNLGSALALTLPEAGYKVKFLATRAKGARRRPVQALARKLNAQVIEAASRNLDADLVWIAVPDDAIAEVAGLLARSHDWKGRIVFHSSGALSSEELAPLHEKGARVASVHPMMTFVRGSAPQMAGVSFALEGDAAAVRMAKAIVRALGGTSFVIKKQNKALYHTFGAFASPLVVALMAALEQVGQASGIQSRHIKPRMLPLLGQTWRNYLTKDAAAAFSGPLVRGDVTTVRKHLAALKKLPEAREVYVALSKAALKRLPVKNRKQMERELAKAGSG